MLENSPKNKQRVMIVAGESSGDLHGSNLIQAAAANHPQLEFFGVGGERMRAAGCQIVFPSDELSVMGLVEVFSQLQGCQAGRSSDSLLYQSEGVGLAKWSGEDDCRTG